MRYIVLILLIAFVLALSLGGMNDGGSWRAPTAAHGGHVTPFGWTWNPGD